MADSQLLLTRRKLLSTTGTAISSMALTGFGVPIQDEELRFFILGDWGTGGRGQRQVAEAMAKIARLHGVDFLISVGDNFYEDGVGSTSDLQWNSRFVEIYSAPELQRPWYSVLGNHDWKGNVAAQMRYHEINPNWNLPWFFYKITMPMTNGTVDFFFLETNSLSRAPDDHELVVSQLEWLAAGLAGSRARWRLVIGHHPVYSNGRHGGSKLLKRRVARLFERYKVAAYVNGHDHDLEDIQVNGVHYLTCGAGAKQSQVNVAKNTIYSAMELGFIEAAIDSQSITISFIGRDGVLLHQQSIEQDI
jgi:tartrate-resistant acid phosphatase type 5